jgi:hypothetical protein
MTITRNKRSNTGPRDRRPVRWPHSPRHPLVTGVGRRALGAFFLLAGLALATPPDAHGGMIATYTFTSGPNANGYTYSASMTVDLSKITFQNGQGEITADAITDYNFIVGAGQGWYSPPAKPGTGPLYLSPGGLPIAANGDLAYLPFSEFSISAFVSTPKYIIDYIVEFDYKNTTRNGESFQEIGTTPVPLGYGNWSVVITSATPEPSSLVLAGIGAVGGLAFYGWSRSRAQRRQRRIGVEGKMGVA